MENAIRRYRSGHRHPVNRALHAIGLPIIIYTFAVLGRQIRICSSLTMTDFLCLVYLRQYGEHDASCLPFMCAFLGMTNIFAYMTCDAENIYLCCAALQTFAWALQILGHRFFENNHPVLMDSVADSFVAAPLLLYYEASEMASAGLLRSRSLLWACPRRQP